MNEHPRSYLDGHPVRGRELTVDLPTVLGELALDSSDRDRRGAALLKQAGLNMVLTNLRAGAELSEHNPRGIVVIHVLSGNVRLHLERGDEDLHQGQLAIIDVPETHSLTALTDAVLLITVSMFEEVGADVRGRSEPASRSSPATSHN
ncbi:MAG: hypothetical protein R3C39_10425 [Dehalococcoidia bacterium]